MKCLSNYIFCRILPLLIYSLALTTSADLQSNMSNCSFLGVYYPFTISRFSDSTGKTSFAPVPEYDNWSIDRMDRDIIRISKSGLDGVLLAIEPSELNDSHKLDLIRSFLVLASKYNGFKVAFLFAPSRRTQLSKSNVCSYLKRKKLLDYSSIYKYLDNNVLFFSDNVELVSTDKPDFLFIKLNLSGKSANDEPNTALIDYPSIPVIIDNAKSNYHIVHIFAGLFGVVNDRSQWIVSRHNGHAFHANLESSSKLFPNLLVISSWNDYAQGSAIENNTLDNTQMQEIFMKFVQKSK